MSTKFIRDPIHGLIEFSDRESALFDCVNTRVFQRLRRIKQCGFVDSVYPSLSHSRFAHSLGSYHVMKRYLTRLDSLLSDGTGDEPLLEDLRAECRFILKDENALVLKAAALLHDIGHTAFSHVSDDLFAPATPATPMKHHELWTLKLLDDGWPETLLPDIRAQVSTLLKQCFWGRTHLEPYAQLLSSAIDVDRLDFLARDSHHAGVAYGAVDLEWILRALELGYSRTTDGSTPVLAYDDKRGLWAIEQLLLARRNMYIQVYEHPAVLAAGFMYQRLIQRARDIEVSDGPAAILIELIRRPENVSIDEYLAVDDYTVLAQFIQWADNQGPTDTMLTYLAHQFLGRQFFTAVEVPADMLVTPVELRTHVLPDVAQSFARLATDIQINVDEAMKYFCGIVIRTQELIQFDKLYYLPRHQGRPGLHAVPFEHHPTVAPRLTGTTGSRMWIVAPRPVRDVVFARLDELRRA